jgi:hypothetical protein
MFIFCIVWSLGSCLTPESRPRFEELLRKVSGRHLPATSLYENFYDFNGIKNWIAWEKLVA